MFNPDIIDLTSALLGPGIHDIETFTYSPEEKSFVLTTSILVLSGVRTLRFFEVSDFQEDIYDLDENCRESIIGIHKADEQTYVIHTDQREFIFKTLAEPEFTLVSDPDSSGVS